MWNNLTRLNGNPLTPTEITDLISNPASLFPITEYNCKDAGQNFGTEASIENSSSFSNDVDDRWTTQNVFIPPATTITQPKISIIVIDSKEQKDIVQGVDGWTSIYTKTPSWAESSLRKDWLMIGISREPGHIKYTDIYGLMQGEYEIRFTIYKSYSGFMTYWIGNTLFYYDNLSAETVTIYKFLIQNNQISIYTNEIFQQIVSLPQGEGFTVDYRGQGGIHDYVCIKDIQIKNTLPEGITSPIMYSGFSSPDEGCNVKYAHTSIKDIDKTVIKCEIDQIKNSKLLFKINNTNIYEYTTISYNSYKLVLQDDKVLFYIDDTLKTTVAFLEQFQTFSMVLFHIDASLSAMSILHSAQVSHFTNIAADILSMRIDKEKESDEGFISSGDFSMILDNSQCRYTNLEILEKIGIKIGFKKYLQEVSFKTYNDLASNRWIADNYVVRADGSIYLYYSYNNGEGYIKYIDTLGILDIDKGYEIICHIENQGSVIAKFILGNSPVCLDDFRDEGERYYKFVIQNNQIIVYMRLATEQEYVCKRIQNYSEYYTTKQQEYFKIGTFGIGGTVWIKEDGIQIRRLKNDVANETHYGNEFFPIFIGYINSIELNSVSQEAAVTGRDLMDRFIDYKSFDSPMYDNRTIEELVEVLANSSGSDSDRPSIELVKDVKPTILTMFEDVALKRSLPTTLTGIATGFQGNLITSDNGGFGHYDTQPATDGGLNGNSNGIQCIFSNVYWIKFRVDYIWNGVPITFDKIPTPSISIFVDGNSDFPGEWFLGGSSSSAFFSKTETGFEWGSKSGVWEYWRNWGGNVFLNQWFYSPHRYTINWSIANTGAFTGKTFYLSQQNIQTGNNAIYYKTPVIMIEKDGGGREDAAVVYSTEELDPLLGSYQCFINCITGELKLNKSIGAKDKVIAWYDYLYTIPFAYFEKGTSLWSNMQQMASVGNYSLYLRENLDNENNVGGKLYFKNKQNKRTFFLNRATTEEPFNIGKTNLVEGLEKIQKYFSNTDTGVNKTYIKDIDYSIDYVNGKVICLWADKSVDTAVVLIVYLKPFYNLSYNENITNLRLKYNKDSVINKTIVIGERRFPSVVPIKILEIYAVTKDDKIIRTGFETTKQLYQLSATTSNVINQWQPYVNAWERYADKATMEVEYENKFIGMESVYNGNFDTDYFPDCRIKVKVTPIDIRNSETGTTIGIGKKVENGIIVDFGDSECKLDVTKLVVTHSGLEIEADNQTNNIYFLKVEVEGYPISRVLLPTVIHINYDSMRKFYEKSQEIENKFLTDISACQNLAREIIRDKAYPYKQVSVEVLGMPHLQLEDVVRVVEVNTGIDSYAEIIGVEHSISRDSFISALKLKLLN